MNIRRRIFAQLLEELDKKHITLLCGPRQVGKSYLMKSLMAVLEKRGIKTCFHDMEQPYSARKFAQDDAAIFDLLTKQDVVFLDEFYLAKNISHILKAVHDSGSKVKIFISGSSSLQMHTHLKESMAGRFRSIKIYPSVFSEFEQVYGNKTMETMTRFGSLPGLVWEKSENDKQSLLENITQTYVAKDIKSFIKEENITAFNHLIYLLAERQGNLINVVDLADETRLSAPTIQKYLTLLQETYALISVPSYSANMGNELKKSHKYYLYDIGVRNSLLRDFKPLEMRTDKGALLETFVLHELECNLKPNQEIRFWRTKGEESNEVDFIFIEDRQPYPIEVKSQADLNSPPKRLISFLKKYPTTKNAFIVSSNEKGKTIYRNTSIRWLPFEQAGDIPQLIYQ